MSSSDGEHEQEAQGLWKRLVHAQPVHVEPGVSHLSREFPRQDFRGFFNLVVLLLVVNLGRLIAENGSKYGLMVQPPWRHLAVADVTCALRLACALIMNIGLAYIMREASYAMLSGSFILGVVLPSFVVWHSGANPVVGMLLLLMMLTVFLKLFSYMTVTAEIRALSLVDRKTLKRMYGSGTRTSFIYFLFAPTLCYQEVYPREASAASKSYILKRLLGLGSSLAAIYAIFHQFTYPTLVNSLKSLEQRDMVLIGERILKLSLSSLFIWLIGFYALFHCWLNVLAELMGFADRAFYRDWWNAGTFEEYWRNWNLPVHNWLKRHVYRPLRKRGYSFSFSSALVFLLSAVAHEYIISIPLRVFHCWAFLAMILQLPLVQVTRLYTHWFPRSSFGNMLFWVVFCIVGQPMGILLYYYSYNTKH